MMRYAIFILISLLLPMWVSAQQTLTFDEALVEMIERNSAIEGERLKVEAADYERKATRGLRYPSIDLAGSYIYMQRNVDIDVTGAKSVVSESVEGLLGKGVSSGLLTPDAAQLIEVGLSPLLSTPWRYTLQDRSVGVVGAQLTLPIYLGGRINAANRASNIALDIARYNYDAVINTMYSQLVERYYGVILARKVAALRSQVVSAVERHLHDAMAMEQEGLLAHSDVVYVEYRLSEAKRDCLASEYNLEVAQRALSSIVGVEFLPSDEERLFVNDAIYTLDYYVESANGYNPLLLDATSQRHLAGVGVSLARAELLPEVAFIGAGAIYNYQLSDMVPRWAVGVSVGLKLFDGLHKERRLMAARATEQSAMALVENAKDDIVLLTTKCYYGVEYALRDMATAERSVSTAANYLKSATDGFNEGMVSAADLLDAEVNLAAAHIERLRAAYQYCCSLSQLLEVAGISYAFTMYRDGGVYVE